MRPMEDEDEPIIKPFGAADFAIAAVILVAAISAIVALVVCVLEHGDPNAATWMLP